MQTYRYVEHGASRYVVGEVKPYDQKNEMFQLHPGLPLQ